MFLYIKWFFIYSQNIFLGECICLSNCNKTLMFILWSVGVLLGILFFFYISHTVAYQFIICLSHEPSVFDLIYITLFLIVVSVLLFYISHKLLFLLCLFKSFNYGFCFCMISALFNNDSWIVRVLIIFPGCCMSILMLFFWIQLFSCSQKRVIINSLIFSSFSVIVSLLDLLYIIPLLKSYTITR